MRPAKRLLVLATAVGTVVMVVLLGTYDHHAGDRNGQGAISNVEDVPLDVATGESSTLHVRTSALAPQAQVVTKLPSQRRSGQPMWPVWRKWSDDAQHLYPSPVLESAVLQNLLQDMATQPIVSAKLGYRGTQLKVLLTLRGGQAVVFKPKRFDRDFTITGETYSGFDRHNAEIAGFHLDGVLGYQRSPPVVGRVVNLRTEILPVAEKKLKDTFFDDGKEICFYGVCLYCKRELSVCSKDGVMEGSVTIWLANSPKLKTWRHPYQRTYTDKRVAKWQVEKDYCRKSVLPLDLFQTGPRLLDIMDATVMDYLVGNADRHHYETIEKYGNTARLLMMDNGKSFGNAYNDDVSVMEPLKQCCRLRRSTWQRIQAFHYKKQGMALSWQLNRSLSIDPLSPVLHSSHLYALDRRLAKLISAVETCISQQGEATVILDTAT